MIPAVARETSGVTNAITAVATAKIQTRCAAVRPARHRSAATTIEGPMMLRMSTFSRSDGEWDQPRIQA